MPVFTLSGTADAPVEDVWKLLFDPSRFPEWWSGIETVEVDGPGSYTQWLSAYPDFPMPQALRSDRSSGRITISCQVRDVDIAWRLAADGPRAAVEVQVTVGESAADRTEMLRGMLTGAMAGLVALAEREHSGAAP